MPKVTAYLDCGCAILEGGSRMWCPTCEGPGILQGRPEGMRFWECPDCGFAFDAIHKNPDGGYTCPYCAEDELRAIINSIEHRLEEGQTGEQVSDWLEGLRAEGKL